MPPIRIGLIRHFEVRHPFPTGWLTWQDLVAWREVYEQAQVSPATLELGSTPWTHCFSSDLSRAYQTAQAAFTGPITQLADLREPQLGAFRTGRLRLPFSWWKQILRVAWLTSHSSQRAAKADFMAKIHRIVQDVVSPAVEDTLIVSHAGVMMFLRKELLKLGFTGPRFRIARNGHLYVFERAR